jgi:D-sedoheptulose 7-phosphate isomerase
VLFDIDGVLTDGRIIVDENGKERKQISLRDIDAVYEIKRQGFKIGAITGEKTEITNYFEGRFPWDYFYRGCKNKVEAIKEIAEKEGLSRDEICYLGDGKYDIDPVGYVGLGVCPSDAITPVKKAATLILGQSGHGAIWELVEYLKSDKATEEERFFKRVFFEHLDTFKSILSDAVLQANVMLFASTLIKVLTNGNQLLIFGNGGSAADAQHIAAEFVSRFYKERRAINAEALTTNTSSLTAIGNDYDFENTFSRQVEAKCRKGDVLLAISTSGKSKNVLRALERGKQLGAETALLTGRTVHGYDSVDIEINVPCDITPRIQEVHIFLGHLICEYVEKRLFDVEKRIHSRMDARDND